MKSWPFWIALAACAPATPSVDRAGARWVVALEGLAVAADRETCRGSTGAIATYRRDHDVELHADDATRDYVKNTPALAERARVAMDAYAATLAGQCR